MKKMSGLLIAVMFFCMAVCSGYIYGQSDEDRVFDSDEPIDEKLLQELCNVILAGLVEEGGSKMVFSKEAMDATDIMLRNPDIKDSTDEDGFFIPAVKISMQRNGFNPRFVYTSRHTVKTICPTIRNFDESDTYGNVAYRIVYPMFESGRAMILSPGFDCFAVGLYVFEDWERNDKGPILDEPKCMRIDAYFVFVDSGKQSSVKKKK